MYTRILRYFALLIFSFGVFRVVMAMYLSVTVGEPVPPEKMDGIFITSIGPAFEQGLHYLLAGALIGVFVEISEKLTEISKSLKKTVDE
jgi:hypothetical protein